MPGLDTALADIARQVAAQRLGRGARREQRPEPEIPHDYQTWGNLAEATAAQFPDFRNWDPRSGQPPPQSEIKKTIGLAGILGEPYDASRLNRAMSMHAGGAHPFDIWRRTQTVRWPQPYNYEQEISGPRGLTQSPLQIIRAGAQPLESIYHYPELYSRIPQIGQMPVEWRPDLQQNATAAYDYGQRRFQLGRSFFNDPDRAMEHEIQHAADDLRGLPLASGRPPVYEQLAQGHGPDLAAVIQEFNRLRTRFPHLPEEEALLRATNKAEYYSLPWEERSRLSEWRLPLSAPRAARISPYESIRNMRAREQNIGDREAAYLNYIHAPSTLSPFDFRDYALSKPIWPRTP